MVTIVITAYNYGQYLKEAIESALNQTVKCEVIVVDDGSTDNTTEIAKSYPVKYIYQENKGLSAARNTGFKEAGEYVLPLDADDTLDPTFVEKCLTKVGKDVGIVRTGYQQFGDSHEEVIFRGEVTYGSLRKANAITATALIPKKVWEEVGGYDEQMKDGYEDWEFYLRVLKAGYTVETIEEPLLNYRQHTGSMVTETNKKVDKVVEYIYKKHPSKGKILFLESVLENMSGVTYYRMVVPGKALEDLGYEVKFDAGVLAVKDGKPSIIIDEIEWADIIVFPRYFNFSPNVVVAVMQEAKRLGKKIVYETDDCLYFIPEHNPVAKVVNQPSSQAMIKFLEDNADIKTVTTEKLKDLVGGNVVICPNSIDTSMWNVENKKTDRLVIGWAGGWTHKKDLEMMIPVLQKLKKKYKFEIRLFGYDPEIPPHRLYYKTYKWAYVMDYPQRLAELGFDIGIAPLVDDEFNQYKSNIKWLEYAMLGIPIVASNLPPYEMIKDGEDGFLATTPAEWEEKLEKLITDAQLRREMGQKARERVLKEYDIKKTIKNWTEAYERISSPNNE